MRRTSPPRCLWPRRRRRQPELLDSDLTEAERETLGLLLTTDIGHLPEEVIQHEESQRVMRQLIADLPAMQREALLLQVVDELPIKEIAEVMGRSLEAINSLLQRARAG